MAGRMPNRIGINAAGDFDDGQARLKRTPMMRICTAPFYAEVVWRGRAGADLCGLIFNHSGRWERVEIGLTTTHPGAGSCPGLSFGNQKPSHCGDKMPQTYLASCPRGGANGELKLGNLPPSIAGGSFPLGLKSQVEVSGRAWDGREKERRPDGTGTPPPPRARQCCARKPDARRAARSNPRSTLVVRPEPGGGQIIGQAAGHRQVADEMRQRVDATDEAAERTAFA